MARDVTIRATLLEIVGDETYELWLQHEAEAWSLYDTGDVVVDDGHQDFTIAGLVDEDDYVVQIRLQRAGRYRAGYLTADPDTWPEQSRIELTPGALEGVGAPTITSSEWERTGSSAQNITLEVTPDDNAVDIDVYRDGVVIDTIAAPHGGPVTYIDDDPTIAQGFDYTARHRSGALSGPVSNLVHQFSGPPSVENLVQSSATDAFGTWTIAWDGTDGALCRVQSDFVCPGGFVTEGTTSGASRQQYVEGTLIPGSDPVQSATFHARVRREVLAFTVTDVSDYESILVTCGIFEDNTVYQSCA